MPQTGSSATLGSVSWRTYKGSIRYASFIIVLSNSGLIIIKIDTQNNAMMNSNGQITELGEQYIGEITVGNDTDPSVSSSERIRVPYTGLLSVLATIYLLV